MYQDMTNWGFLLASHPLNFRTFKFGVLFQLLPMKVSGLTSGQQGCCGQALGHAGWSMAFWATVGQPAHLEEMCACFCSALASGCMDLLILPTSCSSTFSGCSPGTGGSWEVPGASVICCEAFFFSIFFFLNGIAFRQWEWGRFPSWVVTEHLLWRGRWHPMGTDSGCCLSHRALGGFPWVRDTYTWWGACVGLLTVRREAFTLATHSTQPFFC